MVGFGGDSKAMAGTLCARWQYTLERTHHKAPITRNIGTQYYTLGKFSIGYQDIFMSNNKTISNFKQKLSKLKYMTHHYKETCIIWTLWKWHRSSNSSHYVPTTRKLFVYVPRLILLSPWETTLFFTTAKKALNKLDYAKKALFLCSSSHDTWIS